MPVRTALAVAIGAVLALTTLAAQESPRPRLKVPPLGAGPYDVETAEQPRVRLTVVARGLSHPWAIAFLPDGGMLVTERPGRLRLIRDGRLEPTPIAGVPQVRAAGLGGLEDVALHPRFSENHLVYLTYIKPVDSQRGTPALARGRLENGALTGVQDLIVTDPGPVGSSAVNARIAFGPDGLLYMATGGNIGTMAQDPASLRGKILRVRDDGTVPADNPFTGRAGYRPEIFSLGHRNTLALIAHPQTGEIWNSENGPNGGDEINVIRAGRNYGWPLVSFGRDYPGPRVSDHPTREGIEAPIVTWIPSIAASGMAVYTGDRFPSWKGNVFVGAMRVGEIEGTGHLQRIVFNAKMEEIRRESMLTELRQRIREVRQGPDGLIYLLTDDEDGALLRMEPLP
ncbi:MAG: PQQ-dependent sugar dehydrogenase [Vicinamibacterales bacterium]